MKTLHDAANPEEMLKMLAEGADVNCKNKEGITPLHQLASEGHTGGVRILLDAGADVEAIGAGGIRPLHSACTNGRPEVVRMLLEAGADCNVKDSEGWTPLHKTASHKTSESTNLLLEAGAKPNVRNAYGETPLHRAGWGSLDNVQKLLDAGAHANVFDDQDRSPMLNSVCTIAKADPADPGLEKCRALLRAGVPYDEGPDTNYAYHAGLSNAKKEALEGVVGQVNAEKAANTLKSEDWHPGQTSTTQSVPAEQNRQIHAYRMTM